jgi:hypothetical protein
LDGESARRKAATKHKHGINTDIHALRGLRTHDPVFDRAKTVHALDRTATVICMIRITVCKFRALNCRMRARGSIFDRSIGNISVLLDPERAALDPSRIRGVFAVKAAGEASF